MARYVTLSCAVSLVLILGVISAGPARLAAQAPAAAGAAAAVPAIVPATPANAAAFVGDWTVSTTGANGTSTAALSIKVDAGKLTAAISAEVHPRIVITVLQKEGATLFFSYRFDYQGTDVPVVVSLTPEGEKVTAEFDYAGGAYLATGTATKTTKP